MEKVKVGINGYGVIGKRIADAVMLQDDMELVGVTARTPDYRLFAANKKGIKLLAFKIIIKNIKENKKGIYFFPFSPK